VSDFHGNPDGSRVVYGYLNPDGSGKGNWAAEVPRTAAGLALLDIVRMDGWRAVGENGPAAYILAIEAEAAAPASGLAITCEWCGSPLEVDGIWTDSTNGSGDYCPEGMAVGPEGTSPHKPRLVAPEAQP
jgi:hypothetical protein